MNPKRHVRTLERSVESLAEPAHVTSPADEADELARELTRAFAADLEQYRRRSELASERTDPAQPPSDWLAEASFESLRGHIDAVSDPVLIGMIGVRDLSSFVPAVAMHVDSQRVSVREEIIHEPAVALHNEIGLPELLTLLERQTSPQWNNSSSMFMSLRN